jgi:hypothetical protein
LKNNRVKHNRDENEILALDSVIRVEVCDEETIPTAYFKSRDAYAPGRLVAAARCTTVGPQSLM